MTRLHFLSIFQESLGQLEVLIFPEAYFTIAVGYSSTEPQNLTLCDGYTYSNSKVPRPLDIVAIWYDAILNLNLVLCQPAHNVVHGHIAQSPRTSVGMCPQDGCRSPREAATMSQKAKESHRRFSISLISALVAPPSTLDTTSLVLFRDYRLLQSVIWE